MNFEEEEENFSNITFYHPLCNLKPENIINNSKEKILNRKNSEIRVLTYNIFLRTIVKNNENDWKDERLEDFLTLIDNYDIICLQEMFGTLNNRKQKLIRAATLNGFFFFVDTNSPGFTSRHIVEGGLIILSRFPIVSHSFTCFRYGVVSDSLAQKGVIYAKIAIKNSYLHVFSTHLQASYFDIGESNFIASFYTRMEQLEYLNQIMVKTLQNEYNKNSDRIILLGDFNVDALNYRYKPPVRFFSYIKF